MSFKAFCVLSLILDKYGFSSLNIVTASSLVMKTFRFVNTSRSDPMHWKHMQRHYLIKSKSAISLSIAKQATLLWTHPTVTPCMGNTERNHLHTTTLPFYGWDQVQVWILIGENSHSEWIPKPFLLLSERYLKTEISYSLKSPTQQCKEG